MNSFYLKLMSCLLLSAVALPPLHAEAENTGALTIESAADELSADIHIAREEGKEPPRSEEEDKKRTRLGIGELVDLTLTGKESLIGDTGKIQWSILEGKNLVEVIEKTGNPVQLKLDPYSAKGGKLLVQAKTEHDQTVTKEFTVLVPAIDVNGQQKVTAQHVKNPKTGIRGYDEWLSESSPPLPGCSAQLEVTLHPTDVSFHKVEILETHVEHIPEPLPEMGSPHTPLPIGADVNQRNGFIDKIGSFKMMERCKNLPQTWTWVSKWSTCQLSKPVLDITTQHQIFQYKWSAPNEEGVTVKISKFGRAVQRTAIKEPYYTPQRKPETLIHFL